MIISPFLCELFAFWPLVCTRNPFGTLTLISHFFGGTPPVAKRPRAGSNSGFHPSAGRKNASPEKLKAVSPPVAGQYSTVRCKVWRADMLHAWGRGITVFRRFSVEIPVVIAAVSQVT